MGGVEAFVRLLGKARQVGLDSMAFIYQFEAHPRYGPLTRALFSSLEQGAVHACTSELTVCEVLTGALKAKDERLAELYRQIFDLIPNLTVRPVDRACALLAAELRAEGGLRTPDALHVATALCAGARLFVTNDARLRHAPRIEVVVLGDYA